MTTPRRVLAGFAVLLAAGRAAAGGWRLAAARPLSLLPVSAFHLRRPGRGALFSLEMAACALSWPLPGASF
jgi:hypothetical protein